MAALNYSFCIPAVSIVIVRFHFRDSFHDDVRFMQIGDLTLDSFFQIPNFQYTIVGLCKPDCVEIGLWVIVMVGQLVARARSSFTISS